jgi:hypothetical protein
VRGARTVLYPTPNVLKILDTMNNNHEWIRGYGGREPEQGLDNGEAHSNLLAEVTPLYEHSSVQVEMEPIIKCKGP